MKDVCSRQDIPSGGGGCCGGGRSFWYDSNNKCISISRSFLFFTFFFDSFHFVIDPSSKENITTQFSFSSYICLRYYDYDSSHTLHTISNSLTGFEFFIFINSFRYS